MARRLAFVLALVLMTTVALAATAAPSTGSGAEVACDIDDFGLLQHEKKERLLENETSSEETPAEVQNVSQSLEGWDQQCRNFCVCTDTGKPDRMDCSGGCEGCAAKRQWRYHQECLKVCSCEGVPDGKAKCN